MFNPTVATSGARIRYGLLIGSHRYILVACDHSGSDTMRNVYVIRLVDHGVHAAESPRGPACISNCHQGFGTRVRA